MAHAIALEQAVRTDKLLIVAPQTLPTEPLQAARLIGWTETPSDEFKVIGRGNPHFSELFFRRLKLDLPLAAQVLGELSKFNPGVIYTANESVGLPLAVLNRFGLLGDRNLLIYNHNPLSDGPLGIKKWLTKFGAWDMMVCQSPDEERRFIEKFGSPQEKVGSSFLPYNVSAFHPQDDETKLNDPYILSIGVSKRDYPTLVEAMRLPGQKPDLRIDPSSPSDPLKGPEWQQNLPSNIGLVHFQNPQEHNLAVEKSLFVTLAIQAGTPQKDAGCTMVQAGASAGIPTVAATEGLGNHIKNGLTGLIVEPNNPQVLNEAIIELSNNHELRRRMGKAAYDFAVSEFTSEAHTQRIRNIIDQLSA